MLTAKKAFKISKKAKDPQSLKGMLEHIKSMSELGFTTTSVILPSSSNKKAQMIKSKLNKLGYGVSIDNEYFAPGIFMEVNWREIPESYFIG